MVPGDPGGCGQTITAPPGRGGMSPAGILVLHFLPGLGHGSLARFLQGGDFGRSLLLNVGAEHLDEAV